jgi:demethylmenaquinone methyltransferase/2-methoxy-6-polyprenyl-1,4-benzoquinol methylase
MRDRQENILSAQLAYYGARAPEYDDWWHRRGRYDLGAEANGQWFRECDQLYGALERAGLGGAIVELACGTGTWTGRLADMGLRVTAVDGSPEMLALNRAKVGGDGTEYVKADLFEWTPARRYDGVVMGFWLSHVPPDRLHGFLTTVRSAVREGAAIFLVDSQYQDEVAAQDRVLAGRGSTTMTRILADGRSVEIVKVFYEPAGLEAALGRAGFSVKIERTDGYFIHGAGRAV